jgi:trans-aconitate 2-methyltransferase
VSEPQPPRQATLADAQADAWNAARYARHSSLQEQMAAQVLSLVELRGDERVLDIGCGDGRISARIAAERVSRGSVLGVDASADMIAFAQRRHAAVGNLKFAVADAAELAFEGDFDAAVSFNALHWLHQLSSAFRGIKAALVPGGRAWLRLVTRGPVTSLEEVAEQVRRESTWAPLFTGFVDPYLRLTAEQVVADARAAGLRLHGAQTRLEGWDFGTRDAFFGFCSAGFGAWTTRLPADRRDAFVGAVLDRYLGLQPDPGGALFRFYQTDLTLDVP